MSEADSKTNKNGTVTGENLECADGGKDETDVFGTSFFKRWGKRPQDNIKCGRRDFKGKPMGVASASKDALFYNMNHKKRGIALILNHENFQPHMKLKPRLGTKTDAENLERTLQKLGFDTDLRLDLKSEEVLDLVKKVGKMDHTDYDCFVLALLSHGEQNIIYASDLPYKPEELWLPFTGHKCISLAGKPKLFFIQACRGDQLDSGVSLELRDQVDSAPSYKIPSHADFFIAYSTIPGYYSWRNTSRGSWFMQAVCDELSENGFDLDLLTMMTNVNRKVAIDYESNVPDNMVMHAQKQIPCITYMLTRLVRFLPKQSNETF